LVTKSIWLLNTSSIVREEVSFFEGNKHAANEESINITTAETRVKFRTVPIASIPPFSKDGVLSAQQIAANSAKRPKVNIAYAYRRHLQKSGTDVTTHVTFAERKKFRRALNAVKPPTAILTYDSMLESGCSCELALAII